jgi:hypothetical protein
VISDLAIASSSILKIKPQRFFEQLAVVLISKPARRLAGVAPLDAVRFLTGRLKAAADALHQVVVHDLRLEIAFATLVIVANGGKLMKDSALETGFFLYFAERRLGDRLARLGLSFWEGPVVVPWAMNDKDANRPACSIQDYPTRGYYFLSFIGVRHLSESSTEEGKR